MGTTRLELYNGALIELGERTLASLTENREPRRVLDDIWDRDFVDYVLEQGLWNFAMRTVQVDYSPSIAPDFGYNRVFDKQTDYIRTAALASDEFFQVPLLEYTDEINYVFANIDTIYMKYISNDASFGGDLSIWPATFTRYAELELAKRAVTRISQSSADKETLMRDTKKARIDARSKDAMNEPTKFMPKGSWELARTKGRDTSHSSIDRSGL